MKVIGKFTRVVSRRRVAAFCFSTLSLIVLLMAGASEAATPRAREWCGIVEGINYDEQTLTIRSSKKGNALQVLWKKDTRFVRDGKFEPAGALKKGAKVCVYYHSPFFGRPFATKVVWQNDAPEK